MGEHYYLISVDWLDKFQMVVSETCEYDAKDTAYNILLAQYGRIARIKAIEQLSRRPHPKRLTPLKGCSSGGKQWAWLYQ